MSYGPRGMSGSSLDCLDDVPELPADTGTPHQTTTANEGWPIPVDRSFVRAAIIELNRAGIFVCDRDYRIWDVDGAFLDMESLERDQVIGRHVAEIVGPDVFSLRKPYIDMAFAGQSCRLRVQGVRKHMCGRLFEVAIQPISAPGAEVACVVVSVRDISQFEALHERLSLHEEIVRQTTDRISVIGTDFRYKFTNAANAAFYGMQPVEFEGLHVSELIGSERFDGRARNHFLSCFSGQSVEYEHDLVSTSGEVRFLRVRMDPYRDADGTISAAIVVMRDITAASLMEKELRRQAREDALTGLANRHVLQADLEDVIARAAAGRERAALLTIDLDDFKIVNDISGHSGGDALLCQIAGLLKSREANEQVRCARLGGDEFAVLVEMVRGDEPAQLAERVVHAIAAIPLRFRGSNLRLTASVGIAHYPRHGDNAEDLVAHADTAMYQAKERGKNTWAVYDPSRNVAEAMLDRMTWSSRIAHALDGNGLELHFQGVYHTRDGSLSHLEALVRMKDPADPERLIMPGQFIPVAEKNGQILAIDHWVIRESIATLARHPDLAALAVNVSGRSFDEPGLPHYIQSHLAAHGVAPHRLIIELTETAAVAEMQDAQRFIEALQQTGCRICLDDFGSGFSTFAYLKYLGAQILKIDGMFIRDLPNNRDNQTFVKAMIDVARGLGKTTVAEFVEDAATLEMLASFGVDMAQGYHLDRPAAAHPSLSAAAAPAVGA